VGLGLHKSYKNYHFKTDKIAIQNLTACLHNKGMAFLFGEEIKCKFWHLICAVKNEKSTFYFTCHGS